ncbi:hypothetical protein T12_9815 [Trichinella patagoniensis]|uniref:Uncharacterized protein n=1 Tax=Trichinella patagoniensis TaxID=990121 RepID=A0A0V1A3S5_9BILA|nr:hypothetical protein T12_9815 [Trichinella patagoniensis]
MFIEFLFWLSNTYIFIMADQFESTNGSFVKVFSSFQQVEDNLLNNHHCVYNEDHILLFGQKGISQPRHSSFRNTVLLGSYAIDLNLINNTTERFYFSALDKSEDKKEVIFTLKRHVYMIVYSEYERCDNIELFTWSDRTWKSVSLKVDSKVKSTLTLPNFHCKLHYTVVNSNVVIFAFSSEDNNNAVIAKLSSSGDVFILSHLFTIEKMPFPKANIMMLALNNEILYAMFGSHGCGFRWHPDKLMVISLKQGSMTVEDIAGERPKWAFSGPQILFQYNDKMLLMAGSSALGLTLSEFDRDIWYLNLSTKMYRKIPLQLPDEVANYEICAAFDADNLCLYVTNVTNGLYKADLSRFLQ